MCWRDGGRLGGMIKAICECRNPSLGFTTKARACNVACQKGSLGVMPNALGSVGKCEGMNPHTPPRELPLWELESQWIPRFSKSNFKGQNSIDWGFFYIIKNILERTCLKWDCMTHLDTSNTSYGQKKGRESNWQFDSWPLKARNRPKFLAFRWRATYYWKALNKGYNFSLNLIWIIGLHTKLWDSKIVGVPILGIPGTPTWESQDKMTFGCWSYD